ncbi:MAG TPA: sugar phosphate nucleotidyltransferase, partial [Candidatus Woesebacteria bacterium]|nr:sugar phosphate nucleotidyltransferase [Candidatus Woesebacteria bacterium]
LPISKTIQKEMLPILNRPVLDYIVSDCMTAGITRFVMVINEHNYQPLHYFRENLRLKQYLTEKGKADLYQQVTRFPGNCEFIFVKQIDSDPYGTSIPLKLAQSALQDEDAFLYITGDDFVFYPDAHRSFFLELIKTFQESNAQAVMSCIEVPKQQIGQFGIIETHRANQHWVLDSLIEKPDPSTSTSNLANISKYVFTHSILEMVNQQTINPTSGEFYITDALIQLNQRSPVVVHQSDGKYLNAGDPVSWLKANLIVAGADPQLKNHLQQFLAENW